MVNLVKFYQVFDNFCKNLVKFQQKCQFLVIFAVNFHQFFHFLPTIQDKITNGHQHWEGAKVIPPSHDTPVCFKLHFNYFIHYFGSFYSIYFYILFLVNFIYFILFFNNYLIIYIHILQRIPTILLQKKTANFLKVWSNFKIFDLLKWYYFATKILKITVLNFGVTKIF